MKPNSSTALSQNLSSLSRNWPLVLGLLLTPWLIYIPEHASDPSIRSMSVTSLIGLGLAWAGFWIALTILVQSMIRMSSNFRKKPADHFSFITEKRSEISALQIARINQHWVTPLGHVRAATDSLAELNEIPQINERLTPALAVIRAANAELRLVIENVLDFYEARAHRLKSTPRKTDIRLQIEDAVTEWEIPAQNRVGLVQYICFQDVPGLVAVDIRLLRRLIDNLLVIIIQQAGMSDCSVTLLGADTAEDITLDTNDSGTEEATFNFELIIDGQSDQNLDPVAQSLNQPIRNMPNKDIDPLFMSTDLSVWLIGQFCAQLGASLYAGETRNGRQGFRLEFSAPVLAPSQSWQPWLRGKSCTVITQSAMNAQAWRGHLSSFGADIVMDARHSKVDCLFVDEESFKQLKKESPPWFQQVESHGRIIALCTQISLRGRPLCRFDWAEISLPIFIRQRVLQALLPRILQKDKPATSTSTTRKSDNLKQNLPAFAGRTALVIDDDPIYQKHLVNLLSQIGIAALSAADGKSGLYQAEQTDLDLILTDMHLPDILGTGIVRMLRKHDRHQHTPIIAITANVQTEVHQSLLEAGADIVLTKPVALGELINAVSQFLQSINSTPPPSCETQSSDRVLDALLCDELPVYRQKLSQSENDPETLKHLAHKLRGAAACCQAKQLQNHAGQLEDQLLSDPTNKHEIDSLTQALIQVIEKTIREKGCHASAH